ncbi:hypothetical protein PHLCEN_2v370 [Hermanssonia centrifuga]|uniref:Uncharacterized protein n=1 Tax=Hermanssonia centrifuga TaxID=98765 RepID=A0A2R6S6D3_9APHY|nr:hypothetical protein PHLCEN_2v5827 [Hermanssonia centrifuga]PSS37769.1 hypothetical protein PHLCEN_2v370 [Hermanssonia centrifuga]
MLEAAKIWAESGPNSYQGFGGNMAILRGMLETIGGLTVEEGSFKRLNIM